MKTNAITQRLFLLIIFLCCYCIGEAQINRKRDVVYLKNGSVIKGTIVEMIPNETLKIQTADGNIFVYKFEEIERTSKEELVKRARSKGRIMNEQKFSPTGYFIITEFSPSISPGNFFNAPNVSAGLINGVQINKQLSLGVGIKATNYSNNDQTSSTLVVPIFLDTRFYFPVRSVHPMISFQCGYSAITDVSAPTDSSRFNSSVGKGQLFMALGVGIRVFINQHISMMTDGGFSFQNFASYTNQNNGSPIVHPPQSILSLKASVGLALSFGKGGKPLN